MRLVWQLDAKTQAPKSFEDLDRVLEELEGLKAVRPEVFKDPFITERVELLEKWADIGKAFKGKSTANQLRDFTRVETVRLITRMANSKNLEVQEAGLAIANSFKLTTDEYNTLEER